MGGFGVVEDGVGSRHVWTVAGFDLNVELSFAHFVFGFGLQDGTESLATSDLDVGRFVRFCIRTVCLDNREFFVAFKGECHEGERRSANEPETIRLVRLNIN